MKDIDRQRTFFFGFLVGVSLLLISVPHFFFWVDIIEIIDKLVDYLGFILIVICGPPLIWDVVKKIKRS
jgi:hypothetical protein